MNIYTFNGNAVRDAEVRYTTSGKPIASFTMAVNYGWGDNKGCNFIKCSMFGAKAEGTLPTFIKKGTKLLISGELRVREYDDKDGVTRTSVEVSVDRLDLIGGRSDSSSGQQGTQHQSPARNADPFADQPDFNSDQVDDSIPF